MKQHKVSRQKIQTNLRNIIEIYTPDAMTDSESQYDMLTKLQRLDEVDRRILMVYAEVQSLQQVANILGVSLTSVRNYIRQIRIKWKALS